MKGGPENERRTQEDQQVTHPKNLLKTFISENSDKYSTIDHAGHLHAGNLEEICSDDEIWIVQSPKDIEYLDELVDHKIKLPGRSSQGSIETISEEFTKEKSITLAYRSTKRYSVKQLKVHGSILVREKIKRNLNQDETDNNLNNSILKVPFPSDLKTRHPLLGANFEERLILDYDVQRKLNRSKTKRRSDEPIQNNDSPSKKSKSRHSNKAKKIKIENDKDEEDLDWVKGIF